MRTMRRVLTCAAVFAAMALAGCKTGTSYDSYGANNPKPVARYEPTVEEKRHAELTAKVGNVDITLNETAKVLGKMAESLDGTNKNVAALGTQIEGTNRNVAALGQQIEANAKATTTQFTALGTRMDRTDANVTALGQRLDQEVAGLRKEMNGVQTAVVETKTAVDNQTDPRFLATRDLQKAQEAAARIKREATEDANAAYDEVSQKLRPFIKKGLRAGHLKFVENGARQFVDPDTGAITERWVVSYADVQGVIEFDASFSTVEATWHGRFKNLKEGERYQEGIELGEAGMGKANWDFFVDAFDHGTASAPIGTQDENCVVAAVKMVADKLRAAANK